MFTISQLRESLEDPVLAADLEEVRHALASHRIGISEVLDEDAVIRLGNLITAVLSSAPAWAPGEASDILERAGEAAELLTLSAGVSAERARLRGALLYELAAMPMMASAVYSSSEGPRFLTDFFTRNQAFGSLASDVNLNGDIKDPARAGLLRLAACQNALALLDFEHEPQTELELHTAALRGAARHLALDMSLTEVDAFTEVVSRRAARATRMLTPPEILGGLRSIGFPPELWDGQARALAAGMLNHDHDAWGLAAPTGTGKTFLARLLIIDALAHMPESKVLYIVPTKALVHQIHQDLSRALAPVGTAIVAVKAQLTKLEGDDAAAVAQAAVLVLTPEKADLLLRIGAEFLGDVSLVVVDEAHHIEDGTRGVLLELYLARLRVALATKARYVLLSAVAPNIRELTDWVGSRPGYAVVEQRSTRMKVGIYKIRKEGRFNRGFIDYTDGTRLRLFESGVKKGQEAGLVQLTRRLASAGPILVVAQGKKTTENIAQALRDALVADGLAELDAEQLRRPSMARLDSRLEREMYPGVELRALIRFGIAYHHAGLPPRVREAVEAAISDEVITYVIATTTLADGVNFPFSTVIVQSLATPDPSFEVGKPMSWRVFTPRKFWNIAGRAGRPGADHEGQVILYEASLKLDKVGSIDPYTRAGILEIPPVTSALATGLHDVRKGIESGEFTLEDLGAEELPSRLPKRARGLVNLVRVGLAHARATGVQDRNGAYFDGTLAAQTLKGEDLAFARRVVDQQEQVLDVFLASESAPSVELVAELGLSIDTLTRLQRWVRALEDWQLASVGNVLYGPSINFDQLKYIIGPVLKHMAELEGRRLSGWYTQTVIDWCDGKPFSQIPRTARESRLEDLIGLMYSEIQHILPWGLYATDQFVAAEAAQRNIDYAGEVNQLAYLVDAGVPGWPALRLTALGFERTDAARLSRAYLRSRLGSETDVLLWIGAQANERLAAIIRGADRRRLDYDFDRLLRELRPPGADPSHPSGE
jgi:superfamily II DNA/RNA helicase